MDSRPDQLYLDLLKKTLSFTLWPEPPIPVSLFAYMLAPWKRKVLRAIDRLLTKKNWILAQNRRFTDEERRLGRVWPGYADSMIGMKRLDNLQHCVETALHENVAGDLIETGVWRGGACILMKGILQVKGDSSRRVFVADSFQGLPKPNESQYSADAGDEHHIHEYLAVSQSEVQKNFQRYGLFDDRIVFLKGWFKDTLPIAPIEKISVMRLDGDMYESTIDALNALYPKLSPGGFCIIDDYMLEGCRKAVHDYRDQHGISEPIVDIDGFGAYWRRNP
jgi:hypothetical protein